MQEIVNLKAPIDAIVAFTADIARAETGMMHTVCYQVRLNPENVSPGGDFIRFDCTDRDENGNPLHEIHGWKRIDEIEIQEVLVDHAQQTQDLAANG